MNCFRHPAVEALVFCRHCGMRLCRECCRVVILGQKRVCSEECARFAALKPAATEEADTPFQRIYAYGFLIVLLATLGGGFCLWSAQSQIARADSNAWAEANGEWVPLRYQDSSYNIFYRLGIRDWRLQFGIGAAIGAGVAILWIRRSNRAEKAERENAGEA